MSLVLNTNIAALNATRNLSATQNAQAQTFQRLSTGLRVNSAKDDAAGLYLAQSQTKDIRGLNMATRNANDGISMSQTAEGALDQIGQNLQRINELAIQSANGTYSDAAREGLQKEVNELTQEINRIVEVTEFNGKKLLNAEAEESVLQIGFQNDANSRISAGIADGILNGQLTNPDGTRPYTFAGASQNFNLDPENDFTPPGSGITTSPSVVQAFNEETRSTYGLDFNAGNNGFVFNNDLQVALGNDIAGRIGAIPGGTTQTFNFNAGNNVVITYTAGVNAAGDGFASNGVVIDAVAIGDDVLDGTTLGSLNAAITNAADATAMTFDAAFTATDLSTVGDTLDFATEVRVFSSNALVGILDAGLTSEQTVNISTQEEAQIAIQQSREAIDLVSELRATFGAKMNRFEAVISGNQIYSENLSAARSRIQDADFAVETSNLAKQQVLQQAGISSLAQANQSSQAILGLL